MKTNNLVAKILEEFNVNVYHLNADNLKLLAKMVDQASEVEKDIEDNLVYHLFALYRTGKIGVGRIAPQV